MSGPHEFGIELRSANWAFRVAVRRIAGRSEVTKLAKLDFMRPLPCEHDGLQMALLRKVRKR
jgi:hypothetical protein